MSHQYVHSKSVADYAARVRILESQGLTTSDAQGVADAEELKAVRCGGCIAHAPHEPDLWECHCGNVAEMDGFFPCDESGRHVEPVASWAGRYVCARCGRVIDGESRRIEGQATLETLQANATAT